MLFIEIVTVVLKFILCVVIGIAAMYLFVCLGRVELYSLEDALEMYLVCPKEIFFGALTAFIMTAIIVLYFASVAYIVMWEAPCFN